MIKKLALAAGLWAAGTLLVLAAPAEAGLIFFDNRADFEAASGLSGITEDFEEANVAPGGFAVTSNPLDATTNDGVFRPGDIAAGLNISSFLSQLGGILVLGDGLLGPSKRVGAQVASDVNIISLDPPVTAIGFDLFAITGSPSVSTTLNIRLFDAGVRALGSTSVTGVNAATPTFFGVVSDMGAIGSLTFGVPGVGEFIDNITFGNAVAQLPEPGSLALFGLGLLGLGVAVRRRRYTYRLSPSGLTRGSIHQLARDGERRARLSCRRTPHSVVRTRPIHGSSGQARG